MPRTAFAILFLAAALSAHAVTPSRQGANSSGGTCPESTAEASVAAEEELAVEPAAVAAKPAPPARAKSGAVARPKAGMRWHSYLPGMFK